jgi:hypothetical protein
VHDVLEESRRLFRQVDALDVPVAGFVDDALALGHSRALELLIATISETQHARLLLDDDWKSVQVCDCCYHFD